MNRCSRTFARARRLVPTFLLAWLASPAPTGAQEPPRYTPEPGDRIRVIPVDGEPIQGRLVRLESSALVVSTDREEARRIPSEEAEEIWLAQSRVGSFAKGGAILGGLATAGAGIALMSALCGGSTDCSSGGTLTGPLIGGAVGAAGGAVLGALVGAMAPRWVRVDPGFGSERSLPSLRLDARVERDARAGALLAAAAGAPLEPALSLSLSLPAPR